MMSHLIKQLAVSVLSVACLLFSLSAHADFRKALDAYIARDGETLLKEVKHAVDTKNDDGLMLLVDAMEIDYTTSKRKDLYWSNKGENTLLIQTLLKQPLQNELCELLQHAASGSNLKFRSSVNNIAICKSTLKDSYIDVKLLAESGDIGSIGIMLRQYQLSKSKEWKKTEWKKYEYWQIKSAEAGNIYYQLRVAFKYLNNYGCLKNSKEQMCLEKNKNLGNYWLSEAVKNFESIGENQRPRLASELCQFYLSFPKEEMRTLKEAYAWCSMEARLSPKGHYGYLSQMYDDGLLKYVAPQLNLVWKDRAARQSIVYDQKTPQSKYLIKAKSDIELDKLPIVTFIVNDSLNYKLSVYQDGSVTFCLHTFLNICSESVLMNVHYERIANFLNDLNMRGFSTWDISDPPAPFCEFYCDTKDYYFHIRSKSSEKVIFRSVTQYKKGTMSTKSLAEQQVATLLALVEKYFPTKHVRCDISNSKRYTKDCHNYEDKLNNFLLRSQP